MNRPLRYLAASTMLLVGAAQAQIVPAGTQLTNQAQVTFQFQGGSGSGVSNIVTTTVQSVCGLSITPNGTVTSPGQSVSILPDETATLTYQVSNTGNDTYTFPLTASQVGGKGSASLSVYVDSNGNGRWDSTDAEASQVELAGGASRAVFVRAVAGASGPTLVDLVSSCAGGQPESGNVGQISVAQSPEFEVTKAFDREVLRPGDTTEVTLTLTNSGGAGREVWLTDDLSQQWAGGLTMVSGSAKSNAPIEYTADGVTWSKVEPQRVWGIRTGGQVLTGGQQIKLTFSMKASENTENISLTNTATAQSDLGGGASASDSIIIRYTPAVAIGPLGQPLAQGEADVQRRNFALTTSDICFDHTVQNTGDVRDTFTVSAALTKGSASYTVIPAQPLVLEPEGTGAVKVCYQNAQGDSLASTVTVRGERGTSDTTVDVVERLESQLPEVVKSVMALADGWKSGDTVETGTELVYTLRVRNPYTQPMTNVVVTDDLPAGTTPSENAVAADGASISGQMLTWNVGTLAAGETRDLRVRVRVTEAADDVAITNVFRMTSTLFPDGLESNDATVFTWNSDPTIVKKALQSEVAMGERVKYQITITNTSETAALTDVVLKDNPSRGLEYVKATSRLNGQPIADPAVSEAGDKNDKTTLSWSLPDLPAKTSATLTYEMLVTPEAGEELLNTARLLANGSNGALDIASSVQQASTKITLLNFAPLGDILGQVFVDADGNGQPDEGEAGVAGARILLAGGRSVVTDVRGRYHFGNVPFGTHALRLDEASIAAAGALAASGDDEQADATRMLQVRGLTTEHFALEPKASNVGRLLSFAQGNVTGELTLWPAVAGAEGTATYQAEVRLTNAGTVPMTLQFRPTLPEGVAPKQPQTVRLAAGQSAAYTYNIAYSGPVEQLLAAPTLEVSQ